MLGGFLAKIKWVEFMDQKDARAARGSKSNLKNFQNKNQFRKYSGSLYTNELRLLPVPRPTVCIGTSLQPFRFKVSSR